MIISLFKPEMLNVGGCRPLFVTAIFGKIAEVSKISICEIVLQRLVSGRLLHLIITMMICTVHMNDPRQ
jgi:hypothetical protein